MNNCKKQTVLESIKDTFKGEDMQTQYTARGYRIDLYFHKYKLAIEVDELGHNDRNIAHEIQRHRAIEKELGCVFIRINSDAENFNICIEIAKIKGCIAQLNKEAEMKKIKEKEAEIKEQKRKFAK